jgi:hypothetical protein
LRRRAVTCPQRLAVIKTDANAPGTTLTPPHHRFIGIVKFGTVLEWLIICKLA